MDMLITAVAIALLCVAAWLLYKRYNNRYKSQPVETDDYDDYEEETPAVQEAVAKPPATPAPPAPAPAPEPKKEA